MSEIKAAIAWLRLQAEAKKSDGGLEVSPAEISFARRRLLAAADGLEAGLHHPEAVADA